MRIGQYCNLWRNFDDVDSTWSSISSIINYYDHHQDEMFPAAGPGRWNDPDMLVIGNPGITVDQARTQMAIWSIWAAPLFMSNDLRFLPAAFKDILLNGKVIAVNQDPLGIMGRQIVNVRVDAVFPFYH
jgi:alpha-N-acetylgalactosaminidase